jgi:hypothetical protein
MLRRLIALAILATVGLLAPVTPEAAITSGATSSDNLNTAAPADVFQSWCVDHIRTSDIAVEGNLYGLWAVGDADFSPHFSVQVRRDAGGHVLRLTQFNSSTVGTTVIAQNTWYRICYRRNDDGPAQQTQWTYINCVEESELTGNTELTETQEVLATFGTAAFIGRMANWKQWSATLTEDEIIAECHSSRPVRYTNLWRWTPLWNASDVNDYSGAGRHWSTSGTVTSGDHGHTSYGGLAQLLLPAAAAGAPPSPRRLMLLGVGEP